MSLIKKNLLFNLLGQIFNSTISFLFLPIYVKLLGVESYGLIGFFLSFQVVLNLLDGGFTALITREFAGKFKIFSERDHLYSLFRTVEILIFVIAFFFTIVIFLASDFISINWLNVDKLQPNIVKYCINYMGLIISFRLIEGIYTGFLKGIQNHVLFNLISMFFTLYRYVGAYFALVFYSNSIEVFFLWQLSASLLSFSVFLFFYYKNEFPNKFRVKFSFDLLKQNYQTSTIFLIISVLSIFNTQIDKIVLSKILSVTEFGIYSISTSVASLLLFLSYPIVNTFYPKFCEIKTTSDISSFKIYFHNGSQFVGIIVSSIFSFLFFFNIPILNLWGLENNVIVEVSQILKFLLLGFLLSAFTLIPYQVLIANGHFKFILFLNVIFAALCPIAYYSAITYFGLLGVTICFAVVNLLYLLFLFFFTTDFMLKNERFVWAKKDVFIVLFTSFSSAFFLKYLLNILGFFNKNYFLIILPIVFVIILLLTALNSGIVRSYVGRLTFKNI